MGARIQWEAFDRRRYVESEEESEEEDGDGDGDEFGTESQGDLDSKGEGPSTNVSHPSPAQYSTVQYCPRPL